MNPKTVIVTGGSHGIGAGLVKSFWIAVTMWWRIHETSPSRMRSLHRKSSRWAVMRSLAMEYAKNGIRVNAVAPGIVDTPLQKGPKRIFSRHCNRWEEFQR
jgi:NAD(P)-dependent dehydrogenase (short-subunit alcohol dehydrogenase family)